MEKIANKLLRFALIAGAVMLASFQACRKEDAPGMRLGIEPSYQGIRLQAVLVKCGIEGGEYEWRLEAITQKGKKRAVDSVVCVDQYYYAILPEVGVYHYTFTYDKGRDHLVRTFDIYIEQEATAYTPYISDVLEYNPAPGRYVNLYPSAGSNTTEEEILYRCRRALCGKDQQNKEKITLGGFGGSITFAFDHLVLNRPGEPDFKIFCDAQIIKSVSPSDTVQYSTSEPGIIMVAYDANGNGQPDPEEWYELRGSVPSDSLTKGYKITYTYQGEGKPNAVDSENKARGFDHPEYIPWQDNGGGKGFIPHMAKGSENSYWPTWKKNQTTLTFTGTRLPNNGKEERTTSMKEVNGQQVIEVTYTPRLQSFEWGYADNLPNDLERGFDISNAVDQNGNPVKLPGIHFVRVYTAVNQQLALMGEVSTEISGAVDLHMLK